MSPLRVDVHSHLCPLELPDFADRFGDGRWPIVQAQPDGSATIMREGRLYRPIDERYFGEESRIRFLDRVQVDVQVVSPLPVLLPYWASPQEATIAVQWQNQAIADFVGRRPDRFVGLGTAALHDAAGVPAVLDQIVDLGLAGVEIGTTYGGRELGDTPLIEFFAAAADRGVPVLVHPLEGAGMGRMDDELVRFSVGVMSDTALAATSMFLAGVLVDHPQLRVCLSHGGGAFFWILPRLERMLEGSLGPERASQLVEAIGGVWVDTASLGEENLAYLQGMLGAERMIIGSDFPAGSGIDPGAALRDAGLWSHAGICHENAGTFLGLDLTVRPTGAHEGSETSAAATTTKGATWPRSSCSG